MAERIYFQGYHVGWRLTNYDNVPATIQDKFNDLLEEGFVVGAVNYTVLDEDEMVVDKNEYDSRDGYISGLEGKVAVLTEELESIASIKSDKVIVKGEVLE